MDIDKKTLLQLSEYSPETIGLLFVADHPRPEDLWALTRIADELRDEQEDLDQPLDIFQPENSPHGPVIFIEHGLEERELEQFLDCLGERMDAAELTGRLTAVQRQWPSVDHVHELQAFTAGLCTSVPEGQDHPPQAVIDHALQWCQIPNGNYYITFGLGQYLVSADSRGRMLQEALKGNVGVGITAFAGRDELRQVVIGGRGTVLYEERYPGIDNPGTWRAGLEHMTDVLEQNAASLNYGLARWQRFTQSMLWSSFIDSQWPDKPHLKGGGWGGYAGSWSHVAVPDAFGVMILSPSHKWLPPTTDWAVTPAAGNRLLVRYNNPEALFASTTPDEGTVMRMRRDMAPILMTEDMLSGRRPVG